MTPKEKAGELFDKYYNPLINLTTDIDYQSYIFKKDLCIQHAKKCALIAIHELIADEHLEAGDSPYWIEVKKEILAL
jgi:hypothetical protein